MLFAGGSQEEDRLDIAERLISEQRYDEAQKILADIMREEPEKFGAAQKLQEQINEQRNSFNYKAQELINVLYEEKNIEKALEIIKELEGIDPNPSIEVKEFLDESYRSALIVANYNRFTDIMNKALTNINNKQYYDALSVYLTGFDLHKEEFDEAGYGNIVQTSVDNSISRLNELYITVSRLKEEIDTANTDVIEVIAEDNLNNISTNVEEYLKVVSDVQVIRNEIKDIKKIFINQNNMLKTNPDDQIGDYFCFYALQLTGGRVDRNVKEGMENTVDLLMEDSYLKLIAGLEEKALNYFASSEKNYNSNILSSAADENNTSAEYYKVLQEITYQKEEGGKLPDFYDISDQQSLIFNTDFPDFMKYQLKAMECYYYGNLIDAMLEILNLKSVLEPDSSLDLIAPENIILTNTEVIDLLATNWNDFLEFMNNYYSSNDLLSEENLSNKSFSDIIESSGIKDIILPKLSSGITRYLTEYEKLFGGLFLSIEPEFNDEKEKLINGEEISIFTEDGTVTRIVRHPDRRLDSLTELKEDLEYLNESFTNTINRWPVAKNYLTKTDQTDSIINSITDMLNKIDSLENNIDNYIAVANEDILTAERLKNEGMTGYRAAQNAKDSNRFLDAKDFIASAITSFDRSLEKQEDEEVRNLRDNIFPQFIAEVNAAENAYVVIEVRELIDDGIQAFRENMFDDSEKILIQAQTRWLDTHVEEDLEIASWLTLVQRARSLVSGFELLETEPGYAEIIQRLNYATEDYIKGISLKESGNITQAKAVFENAIEKLNNIKISHPLLKEANILYLKIQKELDPDSFFENYNGQKQSAQTALRTNNELNMQNSYSILKDYELVITDDRALGDLIYNLEIELGLRIPPPSAQDIAESKSKYNTARGIYDGRQRDLYKRATELLTEAILLWPGNTDAVDLKNRIDIDSGSLRQDFLSADDSISFSRAERLFNERNYIESYSIVQGLWNNTNNRRYPPLIELKTQLETRLGL